jgi:5'-nucleotidase
LVSNDDGVAARGHVAIRGALEALGDVYSVAPKTEQSANSHSLTLHRPLRHVRVSERVHAIDGTPADCIYVALFHESLLPRRPDLVISGINHGPNLGSDIHYSGTVAAAREGALRGIPAMAMSVCDAEGLEDAVRIGVELVERMLAAQMPPGLAPLLNVNFPGPAPKGVRATCLGERTYQDSITVRQDPRGRDYLWIGGPGPDPHQRIAGSDTEAIDDGWISVTPLAIEATHPPHLGLAAWVAGPEPETTK